LVRPDGKKYYAWRSPDNVRWYQESSMDIISIDNPMPGPWQAVGQVTPKNKIKLISHLKLSSDVLPARLYQGESIKYTARLTSDDKPLVLRDFLDRVKLNVTFTKFVENEESLAKEARPIPMEIGE
ncbi:glutamate synthase, partial [Vibrio xuii]